MRFAKIGCIFFLIGLSSVASAQTAKRAVGGDFNGDGKHDVAVIKDDGGMSTLDVYLSDGGATLPQASTRWATRQGGFWDAQKWLAGDFNGDGRDDLAVVFDCGNRTGCIAVHLSNGSSFLSVQTWATNQGSYWDAQQWLAGDFNGDGRTDLAKAFNESGKGSVDVHLSTGSAFNMSRWATKQGGFWDAQKWFAGDFNGDGRADVAKAFSESGSSSIDVHISNGSSFALQRWATRQGGFWDAQKWVVGDFDSDGRDDAALVFDLNGAGAAGFAIHRSGGSSFNAVLQWPIERQIASDTYIAADFTGDGRTDLVRAIMGSSVNLSLRTNTGSNTFSAPPLSCTTQSVAHYGGCVTCQFDFGGIGQICVGDSLSPVTPPQILFNEFISANDVCRPVSFLPLTFVEQRQVCN